MASQVHPQAVIIASAAQGLSSPSPNPTGHMGVGWHEVPSTPPADAHANMHWELSDFSMGGHLVISSGGPLVESSHGHRVAEGMAPIKQEPVMTTGIVDVSTPSLTDSFSSVESDSLPPRSAKNKNTRIVSNLAPEQLERKRSNDRRAQRAIRERTKRRMADYQNVLAQKDEMIVALSRRVQELEEVFRQGDSQRCGRCMSDIGSDGRVANPPRAGDPPSRCPSLQGSLPGSHRGSFASGPTSPQPLPSIPPLPSHDRNYSVMVGGVAATDMAAYNTAQELGAPPGHAEVAWPGYGRGALPPTTLPSSLPNTGPSPAMAHDTMAGPFYSSSPMAEPGTATKLRHLQPYPSPTQRHQAFEGPMVHDEAYEAWVQARSLAMAWGERM